jgi:hypothetical protein
MTGPLDLMEYYNKVWGGPDSQTLMKVSAMEGEIRNFIDGRKSILQVRNAAAAEAAFMNVQLPSLQDVENFIKLLEKYGYVKYAGK